MFGQRKRAAILELHKQGHGVRKIARALRASRNTVRNIIRSGTAEVPKIVRRGLNQNNAEAYRVQILELYSRCRGNRVRLHKELLAHGAQLSYQTLTRFVRQEGISKNQSDLRDAHPRVAESIATAKEWLAEISYGWRAVTVKLFTTEFKDPIELNHLLEIVRNGTLLERKKAATILARKSGISTPSRQLFFMRHQKLLGDISRFTGKQGQQGFLVLVGDRA